MDPKLFERFVILFLCSILYYSIDAKAVNEQYEDKNDVSNEEIDLMIMYIKDGPPVNVFWISNETLKTTLLADEKRLFKADEVFVATHREYNEYQGITWHVYVLFGRCAFAVPRIQAIGIAASIFDKLRNEPNAVFHRVYEWDRSTTLEGVIAIFPHLNPSKQCNLYVVETDNEGNSSVQKVCCDPLQPLRPRPVIGWANDPVGDGNKSEFCLVPLLLLPIAPLLLFIWLPPRPKRKSYHKVHVPLHIKLSPEAAQTINLRINGEPVFGRSEGYNGGRSTTHILGHNDNHNDVHSSEHSGDHNCVHSSDQSGGYKSDHRHGHSPRKPAPIETDPVLDYNYEFMEYEYGGNSSSGHDHFKHCVVLHLVDGEETIHLACGGAANKITKLSAGVLYDEITKTGFAVLGTGHATIQKAYDAFASLLPSAFKDNLEAVVGQVATRLTPMYEVTSETKDAGAVELPLKYSQLKSENCYILDTKSVDGVYLWIGNNAIRKTLMKASKFMEKYFFDKQVEDFYAPVHIVEEKKEPPAFKALFSNWFQEFPTACLI